jgi:hypothetical protein
MQLKELFDLRPLPIHLFVESAGFGLAVIRVNRQHLTQATGRLLNQGNRGRL